MLKYKQLPINKCNSLGIGTTELETSDYSRCPSCNSDEKEKLFESIDIKQSKEIFTIVKCCKCNLIYTENAPNFEDAVRYYGTSYYSYHRKFELPENVIENGKRYLDIGCGSGWHIVDKMKEGYDAYGVEIDPNVVKLCRDRGLKVKQSIKGRIDYESDFFDFIHLNHVLEHLHSLDRMMSEIYRCLKQGGTLQISVPNIESYDAKIYGKYWRHLDVPRHLYHFSQDSLASLLSKHKFRNLQFSTSKKEITIPYLKGLYTTFKAISFEQNIFVACLLMTKNFIKYIAHNGDENSGINLTVVATK